MRRNPHKMMEPLKVGVIGLGVMGRRMLARLATQARIAPVLAWDTDPAVMSEVLRAHPGVRAAEIRIHRQRAVERHARPRGIAGLAQQGGMAQRQLRVVRLQLGRPRQQAQGFRVLAAPVQQDAEQVHRVGIVGVLRQPGAIATHGFVEATRVVQAVDILERTHGIHVI